MMGESDKNEVSIKLQGFPNIHGNMAQFTFQLTPILEKNGHFTFLMP